MATILIVTENKLIRWSLKEILAQEGFSTDAISTACNSLAPIQDNSYALIIVDEDVRTSDQIFQRIYELFPFTNIIVLSNFANERKNALLNMPNVLSIIEKPFSIGQIKSAALTALASRTAKDKEGRRLR